MPSVGGFGSDPVAGAAFSSPNAASNCDMRPAPVVPPNDATVPSSSMLSTGGAGGYAMLGAGVSMAGAAGAETLARALAMASAVAAPAPTGAGAP